MKISQLLPGRFRHAVGVNLGGTVTANTGGKQLLLIIATRCFDRLRVVKEIDIGDLGRLIGGENLSGAELL